MSSTIEINGKTYVYLKGASEFVLELCDQILDFKSSQVIPKTPQIH